MLVGIAVQFGRRSVDEDDVPVVGKLQDTVHVVRMELTDFVHHTVQLEVLELARSPSLNTFSNMMLIMAFTRMSVPSEPTFDSFSTKPVSLLFSMMRKRSSNESYRRMLS